MNDTINEEKKSDEQKSSVIPIDYTNPEELQEHKKYMDHVIVFDLLQDASNLYKTLPKELKKIPNFEKDHADIYKGYQEIIKSASFVALPLLDKKEVENTLEKNLVDMVSLDDLIISEKIELFIATILLHDQRDIFKENLRNAIERNQQNLTSKPITIQNENVKPTVSNWIKKYVSVVGVKPVKDLSRREFFSSNKEFTSLPEHEKKRVQKVLDLYENLKLSSVTIEGLDESVSVITEDGEHKVLYRGRLEDVPHSRLLEAIYHYTHGEVTKEESIAIAKGFKKYVDKGKLEDTTKVSQNTSSEEQDRKVNQIMEAYQGDKKFFQKVVREETEIVSGLGNDTSAIRKDFFKAVQNGKVEKSVAFMRRMAQLNDLGAFLRDDKQLRKYLLTVWPGIFGVKATDEFKNNPESRLSVQNFVQYILQNRLHLSENDAARIGLQISNIYKKIQKDEYQNFSYFDMKDNTFKWMRDK